MRLRVLTPIDHKRLTYQRDQLLNAATKAEIYARALALIDDEWHPRWWRPFRAIRAAVQRHRLERKHHLWVQQVSMRRSVISGWIDVYRVTTGPDRGPITIRREPHVPSDN